MLFCRSHFVWEAIWFYWKIFGSLCCWGERQNVVWSGVCAFKVNWQIIETSESGGSHGAVPTPASSSPRQKPAHSEQPHTWFDAIAILIFLTFFGKSSGATQRIGVSRSLSTDSSRNALWAQNSKGCMWYDEVQSEYEVHWIHTK